MERARSLKGKTEKNAYPWRQPWKTWIVLPAFNEEQNLGPLFERIDTAMHDAGMSYEILVVDDGSKDKTAEICHEYAKVLPIRVERHQKNQGLGNTIRDGLFLASRECGPSDIVIVMDADNTHAPGLIFSMIRVIQEGSDVTIASRYQNGSLIMGVSLFRRMLSSVASLLFRVVFPIPGVKDYTCGYRAYRGTVLKSAFDNFGQAFIDQTGFQSMVDILLKLRTMDLVFREVPMILRYDFKKGSSKMRVFRTIYSTLTLMVQRRLGK
jgi:dolichol-phosphate mannosyltransferase